MRRGASRENDQVSMDHLIQEKLLVRTPVGVLCQLVFAQSNIAIYRADDAFLASYSGGGKRVTGLIAAG